MTGKDKPRSTNVATGNARVGAQVGDLNIAVENARVGIQMSTSPKSAKDKDK